MNNPALDRRGHSLRTVGGVEFAQYVRDVGFDGAFGDAEFVADFFVAHSFGNFLQNQ